jgi:hypothetical protein
VARPHGLHATKRAIHGPTKTIQPQVGQRENTQKQREKLGGYTHEIGATMGSGNTMAKAPIHPKHPERICWGCEKYCPSNRLNCRETRVEHPIELFGDDWNETELNIDDLERDLILIS